MPDWIVPMAASLTRDRFTGPDWLFERKLDGIRILAFKNGSDVQLLTRNRLPRILPRVADAVASLPVETAILDGELTWDHGGVTYHVFDILWLDGRDVATCPLTERRAMLDSLPMVPPLQRVASVDGPEPWARACAEGWEGVIAKRRDAPYVQGRSKDWLKMKCEASQTFVVGGFTDPQGGRIGLGALLVGYYDGADFVFAGKVGTGFDTRLLVTLRERLDALEIERPPFTRARQGHAARSRPLGTTGNRGGSRLHRVDGSRKAAALAARRLAGGSGGTTRGARQPARPSC